MAGRRGVLGRNGHARWQPALSGSARPPALQSAAHDSRPHAAKRAGAGAGCGCGGSVADEVAHGHDGHGGAVGHDVVLAEALHKHVEGVVQVLPHPHHIAPRLSFSPCPPPPSCPHHPPCRIRSAPLPCRLRPAARVAPGVVTLTRLPLPTSLRPARELGT